MIYIICKTLVLLNQLNYLKDNIANAFLGSIMMKNITPRN